MRKIQFIYFAVLLMLTACGDHIQKEKDAFPEIPNFPKFKDNVLGSKKISSIKLRLDTTFKRKDNSYYFNYLYKDSSVYIMTYFTDSEFPKIPVDGGYIVDLVIIKNNAPVKHFRWKMDDFDINFDVDQDHNVIVGVRKYLINTNYLKYEEIKNPQRDRDTPPTTFKEWERKSVNKIGDPDYFKEFDRVTIGSDGNITGGGNQGYGYQYSPVYLSYYKMKYKDVTGLTKINYSFEEKPLFLSLGEEIYYVTYSDGEIYDDVDFKTYTFYKIEANKNVSPNK